MRRKQKGGIIYSVPPFQLFNKCKHKAFYIFGDFNAKHSTWGCTRGKKRDSNTPEYRWSTGEVQVKYRWSTVESKWSTVGVQLEYSWSTVEYAWSTVKSNWSLVSTYFSYFKWTPLYSTRTPPVLHCTPAVLRLYFTYTSARLHCTPLYSTRTSLYFSCTPLVLHCTPT